MTSHSEMNSTWGTMMMFKEDGEDEDRCLRILEKRHKNVEEVRFINLPRTNAKIAKIKFKGKNLPEKIYMGGRRRDLKPFIPKPSQCHKCSKFGHYSKYCNNEKPACFYCSSHDHDSKWQCGGQQRCINCGGDHHSRSQNCPIYKYNAQVKHLQMRTGMSIRDAKEELKERGIENPYRKTTYAAVSKNAENNQIRNQNNDSNEEKSEENLPPTQQFSEASEPKAGEVREEEMIQTSNRFAGMSEEMLDGSEDINSSNETSMMGLDEIEGFWDTPESKPQRSKGGKVKRPLSPGEGNKKKSSREKTSPPKKRPLALDYSTSGSSDEMEKEERQEMEEE